MTIHFDNTARVYEVFAADGEWLGCFDTVREAMDFIDRETIENARAAAEVAAEIAHERRQLSGGR